MVGIENSDLRAAVSSADNFDLAPNLTPAALARAMPRTLLDEVALELTDGGEHVK